MLVIVHMHCQVEASGRFSTEMCCSLCMCKEQINISEFPR